MKLISVIIISFLFFSVKGQEVEPGIVSANGIWKFKTDPYALGESLKWYAPELNDLEWDSLTVPGNWDLRNEYARYVGKGWYRKEIQVPAACQGKTLRLLFEGVNSNSKVWVNGQLAGMNDIGYLPFEFDISKILHYGAKNTIAVMADNTYRLGAVWNWGGIRRPVQIIATENLYIAGQYISPSLDLKAGTADVNVRLVCRNNGSTAEDITGEVLISTLAGFRRSMPFTVNLPPGGSREVFVRTTLSKKEVHLWNCDDPFLYRAQATIRKHAQVLHQTTDRFGLRKIELDNKNYQFKLNGEPMRIMGFNLIPDDRTTGSTLPSWRVKKDVDMLKSLGANMARLTHLPLTKEMYDYLDEKGILVFPEIPLWGFHQLVDKNNPTAKQWLKRLMDAHYNHPSIIGWSVGNEIGDSPGVMEYVEDAIRFVKSVDTTRLAVMVSHTATRQKDPIEFSDLGLINKYGTSIGKLADSMHQVHPGKVLFYSEYGYGQLNESLDADVDAKGMVDSIRFRPYLVGGSLWTFNDYRSSFVGTKEFSESRPWGIVDVFRQKKKAWYSFRKEYAPVRELRVDSNDEDQNSFVITLVPRKQFDLPAYPLKNYVLAWEGFDKQKMLREGGFITLSTIMPGDPNIKQIIKWKNLQALSLVRVELLSPQGYSVYDTTIYRQKPEPPVILFAEGGRMQQNNMPANSGTIRIVFERKEISAFYKVKYGTNDLSRETAATLNSYTDISKLPFNETYQVAAVAVNAAGESDLSTVRRVKVVPLYAPPAIYYVEPADRGFFVGYGTDNDDYVFRIQYSPNSGDYANAPVFQTSTKGVLFVPGLTNGTAYYFRMSRIKDNNYTTGWSEEHTVIPDGGLMPPAPNLQGVMRNKTEAIVVFEPVKKATGYLLQYRPQGSVEWNQLQVNAADLHHVKVAGVKETSAYEFRMQTQNMYGPSAFTAIDVK